MEALLYAILFVFLYLFFIVASNYYIPHGEGKDLELKPQGKLKDIPLRTLFKLSKTSLVFLSAGLFFAALYPQLAMVAILGALASYFDWKYKTVPGYILILSGITAFTYAVCAMDMSLLHMAYVLGIAVVALIAGYVFHGTTLMPGIIDAEYLFTIGLVTGAPVVIWIMGEVMFALSVFLVYFRVKEKYKQELLQRGKKLAMIIAPILAVYFLLGHFMFQIISVSMILFSAIYFTNVLASIVAMIYILFWSGLLNTAFIEDDDIQDFRMPLVPFLWIAIYVYLIFLYPTWNF